MGAQTAHHRASEKRPFGPSAKLLQRSCNDASSRCRSEADRGLRPGEELQGVGGLWRGPTHSYFNSNLYKLSWLTATPFVIKDGANVESSL